MRVDLEPPGWEGDEGLTSLGGLSGSGVEAAKYGRELPAPREEAEHRWMQVIREDLFNVRFLKAAWPVKVS